MRKYCPSCHYNIDDTMGIWKCFMCGGDLFEGMKPGYTSLMHASSQKCAIEKCERQAVTFIGLADPDAEEKTPVCKDHQAEFEMKFFDMTTRVAA